MYCIFRIAITVALLLSAKLAWAHPGLLASTPKAGETLDTPPKTLHLKFNEPIEPVFTSVKVLDPAGKAIRVDSARTDAADPSAVLVQLPTLGTGTYKAQWSAAGRDGHRVRGEFSFTVK